MALLQRPPRETVHDQRGAAPPFNPDGPGFLGSLTAPKASTPFGPGRAPAKAEEPDPLGVAAQRGRLAQLGYGDRTAAADEIIRASERSLRRDPELREKLRQCEGLYAKAAEHEAAGDLLKASGVQIEIGKLERKLQKEFADRVAAYAGARQ